MGDAPTSQYDVTATGGNLASLDATVTLSFAATQNIQDIANNNLTDTAPTGTNDNTYVVDNTAPTVTSIERGSPSSPTNANSIGWNVTFSEDVKDVDRCGFRDSRDDGGAERVPCQESFGSTYCLRKAATWTT